MGVKLSRITGELRTVTIPFGDDGDLNVTFRPGGITPSREEELVVEESQGRGVRAAVGLLCEVVSSWDLLDDTGTPYPLDVDLLMRTLPSDVFVMILRAIKEAGSPGEVNGAT